MNRLAIAMFALVFAVLPARASDVTEAGLKWLAFVDAGRFDDSWGHGSSLLRLQRTPSQWREQMTRLHSAYGILFRRNPAGVSFSKSLPGYPDGSYATVRFQSNFARQRNAAESVTLRFEDGQWRPVLYSLR